MKLVFAHDHRFIERNGDFYSESQFDSSLWKRYLNFSDQVTVLGRKTKERDATNLILSSRKNVFFTLLDNISNPKGLLLNKIPVTREIRKTLNNADILIARLPSEIGLIAVQQAIALKKPYAIEVVGCVWDSMWNYGGILSKLYAPIMFLRTKRAIRISPHTIYVTQHFLQTRYSSNGFSVGCSDVDILEPSKNTLDARIQKIKNKKQTDIVTLGIIGTLRTKYKGIQTILAALPNIRKSHPNIQFRILGEGNSNSWLLMAKNLNVEDIVYFDKTLSNRQDIFDWLTEIDIYLQPSLQEGLPRALVEAMSMACPCIGSDRAGIPELLDNEYLIRPKNKHQLSDKVISLISDKNQQINQAAINWKKSSQYSHKTLKKRRESFFENFLSSMKK